MKKIKLNLGKRNYSILIGNRILKNLPGCIKKLNIGRDALIITNPKIKKIAGGELANSLKKGGISYRFECVPDSEKSKSQKIAFKLIDKVSKYAKGKRVFIIALGGGVIGDLSGFVASVYKRGIPYIQIPTTLLGQIDSSIGGKVAIDLDCGKNLVGAFYQPSLVLCDISLLKSLPKKQLRAGLAEAVKYGIIKDKLLFSYIEKNYSNILNLNNQNLEHIINKCAAIKAKIVSLDEKEKKGIRTILNYGHTIGHAIETAGRFKAYTHGEAIALGMLAAQRIAGKLKIFTNQKEEKRITDILANIGLPSKIKGLKLNSIIKAQSFDKKFIHGKNRFVLPKAIGRVIIKEGIPLKIIQKSVESLRE